MGNTQLVDIYNTYRIVKTHCIGQVNLTRLDFSLRQAFVDFPTLKYLTLLKQNKKKRQELAMAIGQMGSG